MTVKSMRPSVEEFPEYYFGETTHTQEYSPFVGVNLDCNIRHLIDYLNVNNVVTLHCCEGDPFGTHEEHPAVDRGYIHFLNAAHMEQALLLLSDAAREAGLMGVVGRILQESSLVPAKERRDRTLGEWRYEISWAAGGPHPCVKEQDRRGPDGTVFTAVTRMPHADVLALNVLLSP